METHEYIPFLGRFLALAFEGLFFLGFRSASSPASPRGGPCEQTQLPHAAGGVTVLHVHRKKGHSESQFLKIRFFNITYYHKDIFTHFTEIENKNTKLRMKGKKRNKNKYSKS